MGAKLIIIISRVMEKVKIVTNPTQDSDNATIE